VEKKSEDMAILSGVIWALPFTVSDLKNVWVNANVLKQI
jgi:hypothetical protein